MALAEYITKAVLPQDGDGDGFIFDGTARQRRVPSAEQERYHVGQWVWYKSFLDRPPVPAKILDVQAGPAYKIEERSGGYGRIVGPNDLEGALTLEEGRREAAHHLTKEERHALIAYGNPGHYRWVQAVARDEIGPGKPFPEVFWSPYDKEHGGREWDDELEKGRQRTKAQIALMSDAIKMKGHQFYGETVYRRTAEKFLPPIGEEVEINGFFSTTKEPDTADWIGAETHGSDAPFLMLEVRTENRALDMNYSVGVGGADEQVWSRGTKIRLTQRLFVTAEIADARGLDNALVGHTIYLGVITE